MLTVIGYMSSNSIDQSVAFLTCSIISIGSLAYLKRTKNYKLIYYLIAFCGCIIAAITLNALDEILHIGNFIWQILIIMFTFFGLGKKPGLIVSAVVIINITYYFLFSVEHNIHHITNLTLPVRIKLIVELITTILSVAYLIYQFVIIHDHANKELQLANESLRKQNKVITQKNKENITLVQEVHHRVKNNLQIIISLLRLQKNELKSDEAKKQFSEAINRVMVMASIHQKLHKDKSYTQVVAKDYFTELTSDIITLSSSFKEVEIIIESELENIGLNTIVPLGLIVNELVSNSIQHAFSINKRGSIQILITSNVTNTFKLTYKDNGSWTEPANTYSSFGLELIDILTSQLDGKCERTSTISGTEYSFNLKNLD